MIIMNFLYADRYFICKQELGVLRRIECRPFKQCRNKFLSEDILNFRSSLKILHYSTIKE
jgi:hypothetical protein